MKKRILSLSMTLFLCLGLCGCGPKSQTGEKDPLPSSPIAETIPAPASTPTTAPTPTATPTPIVTPTPTVLPTPTATPTPTEIPTQTPTPTPAAPPSSAPTKEDKAATYRELFNETYWCLTDAPTIAGNHMMLFHSNGTYDSCTLNGPGSSGTWSCDNGKLMVDRTEFVPGDGKNQFISKEGYEVQGISDWHAELSPGTKEKYDGWMSDYYEGQKAVKAAAAQKELEEEEMYYYAYGKPSSLPSGGVLADGTYTVTLRKSQLNQDKNGNIATEVFVIENATFSDDYVRSLHVGDSFKVGDVKIKVQKWDERIYADSYEQIGINSDSNYYFRRPIGGAAWELRTYNDRFVQYFSKKANVTIPANVKITDEMGTGAKSVTGFFDANSYCKSYDVFITVSGGKVTALTFPYYSSL